MFNINNKTIDSELQIANEFNIYFVSIGPKLASHQISTTLNPLNSLHFNANSVVIHDIEENEVVRIINSLNNSSPGWTVFQPNWQKESKIIILSLSPFSYTNLSTMVFFQMSSS